MANVKVLDMAGKEVGAIELSDKIYGITEINGAVLHAAVRMYLLNQRQGTQSTLTRTEVSGGGKKVCSNSCVKNCRIYRNSEYGICKFNCADFNAGHINYFYISHCSFLLIKP